MAVVHAVVEEVGQGDDLDVFIDCFGALSDVFRVVGVFGVDDFGSGTNTVHQRAGTAAAAADEADPYLKVVAAGGMDVRGTEGGECAGAGDGGGLEEVAAGNFTR